MKCRKMLKSIFQIAGAIIALLVAFFGTDWYIGYKIDKKIQDPEILRSISSQIRPAIIFNQKGHILYDLDGMNYIDDIILDWNTEQDTSYLTLKCKKVLSVAPVIECINGFYSFRAERKPSMQWYYKIHSIGIKSAFSFSMDEPNELLFRAEIIQ